MSHMDVENTVKLTITPVALFILTAKFSNVKLLPLSLSLSLPLSLSLCCNGYFPGGLGLAGTKTYPFWILFELRMTEVVVIIET